MSQSYKCPGCKKVIARESWPKKGYSLALMSGVKVTLEPNMAPRLICSCGQLVILLKGSK